MHTNEFNTLKTFNAGVRHISVTTKASPFDGEQNADSQWTPYQNFYHIHQYIKVMKHLLTHVCLVTVSC